MFVVGLQLAKQIYGGWAMSTWIARAAGSAVLNVKSYEEVEADRNANLQAILVVIVSSLGAAVGTGTTSVAGIAGLLFAAILSWLVWVFLTLFIGTAILPGSETRVDFGQVLRTTGFSSAPGVFRALGSVPVIGFYLFSAVTVWMLVTFVLAIRQAMDYTSTGRALAVCLLGWVIHAVLFFGFVMIAL
jgi:hypothetical protein